MLPNAFLTSLHTKITKYTVCSSMYELAYTKIFLMQEAQSLYIPQIAQQTRKKIQIPKSEHLIHTYFSISPCRYKRKNKY